MNSKNNTKSTARSHPEYATLPIRVAPLDESPGFIIHCLDTRLSAGLSREFQNAGYDVTPEQWAVLNRLWQEEGIHQAELAQRTSKDRHNITRILNLMEKNGFIIRKPDKEDKRRLNVYLTSKGRNMRSGLIEVVIAYVEECLRGLDPDDIRAMKRIHTKILDNLSAMSDE
jgi:DNA-binding MarR family transcriptional regulator